MNAKAHKPIIDRATFEAANVVKGVVPARSGNASGLLSGVLRCAGLPLCHEALDEQEPPRQALSGVPLQGRAQGERFALPEPCVNFCAGH